MTASKSKLSPRITRSQAVSRKGQLFPPSQLSGDAGHDAALFIECEEQFP